MATRVCPNCGSTDISVDRSNVISMMALEQSYVCESCGYSGIFPEVDSDRVTEQVAKIKERGRLSDIPEPDGPTTGRIFIGILFFVLGIPAALYMPWGGGKLAGLLSILIGAGVFFEYVSHWQKPRNQETNIAT